MAEPVDFPNIYENQDRLFYYCEKLDVEGDSSAPHSDKVITECDYDEANLISSLCYNGLHRPVLDLDFPCELIPSSSSNCFHLYINRCCTWEDYENLLIAMRKCGFLQKGFVDNSIRKKASFVRPPWIKKPGM